MENRKTLFANKISTVLIGDQIVLDFGTLFPVDVVPEFAEVRSPYPVAFNRKNLSLVDETIVYIDKRTAAQLYSNLRKLANDGMFDEFGPAEVAD